MQARGQVNWEVRTCVRGNQCIVVFSATFHATTIVER